MAAFVASTNKAMASDFYPTLEYRSRSCCLRLSWRMTEPHSRRSEFLRKARFPVSIGGHGYEDDTLVVRGDLKIPNHEGSDALST